LRRWYDAYEGTGLVVVGVHSPEFFWEKSYDKVVDATRRLGVRYPVVQDNDHGIWKRFGVHAWPTTMLVDRRGVVRYQHIGEGEYDVTEQMIQRLLREPS
jgi:alkyl hydroperoxide reductase subunit AhpC